MLSTSCIIISIFLPVMFSGIAWLLIRKEALGWLPWIHRQDCWFDIETGEPVCRWLCSYGYYSSPGMEQCQKWLTCEEILQKFDFLKPIGHGAVKGVFLVMYQDQKYAFNYLDSGYVEDFTHGKELVRDLQPSQYVVQLIGICENIYVTTYHKLGTAKNFENILKEENFEKYNNIATRFRLCIRYAEITAFLHSSPSGVRVMCDTNDLNKTLDQFLLTNDLNIVVNDLDALPQVDKENGKLVKCGHRELFGEFVAPEQLWPFEDRNFTDSEMPGYDEKTDIWKMPDMCDFFLGTSKEAEAVKFHLFSIHKKCKREEPQLRPSAADVLSEYNRVWKELEIDEKQLPTIHA
ncbi:protein O-mannose kinase [Lingula anatina]|uniref:Protein O-mannose kinase n=1 Tax=Lingula anatina TaxID=7574 RepID=A0A1S3II83_LINAN|nr:protein O-mannose kinase [Lingula anatina]|eukprot:XP_013397922.1 protein O-mannose kinase [Lingula anatina]